jgi:hypothetical protein
MNTFVLASTLMASLNAGPAFRQEAQTATPGCGPERTVIGSVSFPEQVLADGRALAAGDYDVRLTGEQPKPVAGQSASGACWVEFVRNNRQAGREVATVISGGEIGDVAKGSPPTRNQSRVDRLKGGDYVRAWINHAGTHYILNMPPAR